jgi:hypothetical protein
MVPVMQELTKVKDMYNKERMARLGAQQELGMLKDQIMRLEHLNSDLHTEVKQIPPLQGENDMLKGDLNKIRKSAAQDKSEYGKRVRAMESQAQNVENVKAEVR